MNTIEIVFSIYGMIAITLVLVIFKKIDTDNKRIKKRMLKEVKHGEWEHNKNNDTIKCSMCGFGIIREYCGTIVDNPFKFCPNCGADMRGETK